MADAYLIAITMKRFLSKEAPMRLKTIISIILALTLCHAAKADTYSSKGGTSKPVQPAAASDDSTFVPVSQSRLARVTAYWPGEDYYTNHKMTASGARLRPGFCAVDSNIIPYGSVVAILGVGNFLAMDTGTAVISRKAAKESGHNRAERSALVIDLYFASRKAGELFSREGPKFAMVAWGYSTVASN
jgi:3D (Asp-Asp-Asp) domain-containing protein